MFSMFQINFASGIAPQFTNTFPDALRRVESLFSVPPGTAETEDIDGTVYVWRNAADAADDDGAKAIATIAKGRCQCGRPAFLDSSRVSRRMFGHGRDVPHCPRCESPCDLCGCDCV